MLHRLILLLIGIHLFQLGLSQTGSGDDAKPSSLIFSGMITSRGLGADVAYTVGSEFRQYRFGLEVRQIKDSHEALIDPANPEAGGRYVFGKLNSLTQISPTAGIEWNLLPTTRLNPFNLRVGVLAGPGIGLVNPYQLLVCTNTGTANCNVLPLPYDPDRHNFYNIQGRARIRDRSFNPEVVFGGTLGAYGLLDFVASQSYVNGVTFGLRLDAFTETIPLVVESSVLHNRQVFLTASVGFVLGSRN